MKATSRRTMVCKAIPILLLSGFVTGCETTKSVVDRRTAEQDLLPLPYPQAGAGVGALRWGEPERPAPATMPAQSAFSKKFLDGVQPVPVSWESLKKERHFRGDLSVSPGPQILAAAKLACGSASAGLSRDSLKLLDWGELSESTVDLQSLSEACVRGWCNLPGKALANEALFQMKLDEVTYAYRPWVVVRSVASKGLKCIMSGATGIGFQAKASQPVYGSTGVGVDYKVLNETTLVINQPMVIGYDVALLEKIEPPLPKVSQLQSSGMQLGSHRFVWRLRRSKELVTMTVDLAELRSRDARSAPPESRPAEAAYPPSVVNNLANQVQSGQAVPLGLSAEVRAPSSIDPSPHWRRIEEGGTFFGSQLVRLRLILDGPAYVYILAKDSKGQAAVLYPRTDGEPLSLGEEKLLPKGSWIYPLEVNGDNGMKFDSRERAGTESFVVIASKNRPHGLLKAMSDFSQAAREISLRSIAPPDNEFGFHSILRLPVGTAEPSRQVAGPEAPPVMGEPLFAGVGSATVLKLSLNRVPSN